MNDLFEATRGDEAPDSDKLVARVSVISRWHRRRFYLYFSFNFKPESVLEMEVSRAEYKLTPIPSLHSKCHNPNSNPPIYTLLYGSCALHLSSV